MELGVSLSQLLKEDGSELNYFRFVPSGRSNQTENNPSLFFTVQNIHEFVRLTYTAEHPLD